MSHRGGMLFAGTNNGMLRSLKFPSTVPGEWQEHMGHGARGVRVPSFQLISSFLKIFWCRNFSFFFHFQPILSFYHDFTLFFLVFCLWPLTPLWGIYYQGL